VFFVLVTFKISCLINGIVKFHEVTFTVFRNKIEDVLNPQLSNESHSHLHHLVQKHNNPEWFYILVPAYPGCPGNLAVKTNVVVVVVAAAALL